MNIPKTDAFEYHQVLKRLSDMTVERDALVSVKIALVDKVEMLENLIASMVIECDENMPAKAAWLARRNGLVPSLGGENPDGSLSLSGSSTANPEANAK